MQEADAFLIKQSTDLPINLEMGNTQEMIDIALKLQPTFICLVPETREEVTTEGGLDVAGLYDELAPTVKILQKAGMKISMFVDPDIHQIEASAKIGAEMVEIHTGCFANAESGTSARNEELSRLRTAAERGHELGVQVNAGHGINYENIHELYTVPHLKELNIGHTIVARSVRVGFQQAVAEMRELMKDYDPNHPNSETKKR
jgi:pyridoxine 5-phosphate synthase